MKVFVGVIMGIIVGLLIGFYTWGTLFDTVGSGIIGGLYAKMISSKSLIGPQKGEPGQPLLTEAERDYYNRSNRH